LLLLLFCFCFVVVVVVVVCLFGEEGVFVLFCLFCF